LRWRYQKGRDRATDIEVVIAGGRVQAARIGAGGKSWTYDDPQSLKDLSRLLRTMPRNVPQESARYALWWDGDDLEGGDE
jgi:hypothetical protein